MKNVLDERCREALQARMDNLTPEAPARWGKLNVGQMVCHCTDPMRIALGELKAKDVSTFVTKTLLKWAVLAGMPPPKGKVDTFAEIDQVKGAGTPTTTLEADVTTLKDYLARIVAHTAAGNTLEPSPAFGNMSNRSFGRLQYVHIDYHLRQFGA